MEITEACAAFLHAVEKEYGYSSHTIAAYRRDLAHLTRYCDQHELTSVSRLTLDHLRDIVWQRQQSGKSAATIARLVATFKSFGKWLEQHEHVPSSPASRLRAPKTQRTLPRVLGETQIERILERVSARADTGDPQETRDYAIFELLYATALRVSELVSITEHAINFSDRSVRVRGKGNKERIVPFGAPAAKALNAYQQQARPALAARANSGCDRFFLGNSGEELSPSYVYRIVARELEQEPGSGPKGPHTLRHTAATHLLNGGAELRVVGELLGHSSLASTQMYTHVSTERLAGTYRVAHPRA